MGKDLSERIREEIAAQLGRFLILDDRIPERVEVQVRYEQMDARLKIDMGPIREAMGDPREEGCAHG